MSEDVQMISGRPPLTGYKFEQGIGIPEYDYANMTLTSGNTTEVYTFYKGGSTGGVVATITVVYTDNTRTVLSTITRS